MKKIIGIVFLLIVLPLLLIVFSVVALFSMEEQNSSYNYSSCNYNNYTLSDMEMEQMRSDIKRKLIDEEMTNAVIGIYQKEKTDVDQIIQRMNGLYEYTVNEDYKPNMKIYIQAYKYGTDYMKWLRDERIGISIATNKRYMQEVLNADNEDYSYYMSVLSYINKKCSTSVDGLPVNKPYTITGWFPYYNKDGTGDKHMGIDLGVPIGTDVYAIANGEVVQAENKCNANGGKLGNMCGYGGSGNYIHYRFTKEDTSYDVWYLHLEKAEVNAKDHIIKGQRLGTSGNSGNSTGAHLHIEIHKDDGTLGSDENIINPCEMIENLCEITE